MTRKKQKILFIIFVAFFIISVPFVLLYTAGWSFNPKKWKFEKTGSLFVNTLTPDVSIFLDDKKIGAGNEFLLKRILPGEYSVRLEKNGYFGWKKKLDVQSRLTAFVKDVRLVKIPAVVSLAKDADGIWPAQYKEKLIITKKGSGGGRTAVLLAGENAANPKLLAEFPSPVKNISWSADGKKALIEHGAGRSIIDEDGAAQQAAMLADSVRVRWDEKNPLLLYAQNANGIYEYNLFFNTFKKLFASQGQINDFAASDGALYIIKSASLKKIGGEAEITIPLKNKNYKIRGISGKKIFLIDKQAEKLQIYSLPLNALSSPILTADAKDYEISDNVLLFYNDFELFTYNFLTDQKELITRFGKTIKKAAWTGGTANIIFALDGQIKLIELDKRDGRQIFEIFDFGKLDNFFLTRKFRLFVLGGKIAADEIFFSEL